MAAKKTAKKTTSKKPAARAVIVTTAHRGVFFGYAKNTSGETISLERGRNCLYWDAGVQGFVGLASPRTGRTRSALSPGLGLGLH
jgi:hypothetical protein